MPESTPTTTQQEDIRLLREELKNLFHYEPYNEIAINHVVAQLDKLQEQQND